MATIDALRTPQNQNFATYDGGASVMNQTIANTMPSQQPAQTYGANGQMNVMPFVMPQQQTQTFDPNAGNVFSQQLLSQPQYNQPAPVVDPNTNFLGRNIGTIAHGALDFFTGNYPGLAMDVYTLYNSK